MSSRESWAARLHDVLDARLHELDHATLQGLVARGVREATDLDFKREVYSGNEKGKRSFAGDVAAMANERGGLILIGVVDADGAASDLNPIELSEAEELRMKSTAMWLAAGADVGAAPSSRSPSARQATGLPSAPSDGGEEGGKSVQRAGIVPELPSISRQLTATSPYTFQARPKGS